MVNLQKKSLYFKWMRTSLRPDIKSVFAGQRFRNAERTGDEKAAEGSSWKEYWQIFTLRDIPNICPFCGEPLAAEEAEGCHVNVAGMFNGKWSVKKYIIPGHHRCNMLQGEEFVAKIAVKAVEAIEK